MNNEASPCADQSEDGEPGLTRREFETLTEGASPSLGQLCQPAFIDEAECLRRVPVARRTWFEWRKRGLPFIRPPGSRRVLYHWQTVQTWLIRQQRAVE
jgi:hypothetical protein